MYCGISGVVPKEPVVSRANGMLYEKSLIESHINAHGRDPITNEPLSTADLQPVRSGAASSPRAVNATSVPTLLAQLQSEWDGVMLEQFSLRQQLASAQQELAHALYKHDAACRVIARVVQERDEARKAAGLPPALDAGPAATSGSVDAGHQDADDVHDATHATGLPAPIVSEINADSKRLQAARKARQVPRGAPTKEMIKGSFTERVDYSPSHMNAAGVTCGVTCVAVQDLAGGLAVFSGGSDGKTICYDANGERQVSALIGHTGPVHRVAARQDYVVTCAGDSTTKVWRSEVGNYMCSQTLKGHKGAVRGLAVLPSGRYVLTGGADGVLNFQDLEAGCVVAAGGRGQQETALGISSLALHPDGWIAATASGSTVHIWDVRSMEIDTKVVLPANVGNVGSVALSDSGLHMAVGASLGVVNVYDLRSCETPLGTVMVDPPATSARPSAVREVAFDPTGRFLAAAGNGVRVYGISAEGLDAVATFPSHQEEVTCVAWSPSTGSCLVSGSMDRHVKLWGSPQA